MLKHRYHVLTKYPVDKNKDYCLYWLQSTQRTDLNYGLNLAIKEANKIGLPLKVLFILTPNYPDANLRHYKFMVEGLPSLQNAVEDLDAEFVFEVGNFLEIAQEYLKKAALMITDFGYLNHHKALRKKLSNYANELQCGLIAVESDVIVPIEKGDLKCTYSARTLRPKLLKVVDDYLHVVEQPKVMTKNHQRSVYRFDEALNTIETDAISVSTYFKGGRKEALKRLTTFLNDKLSDYPKSQDPSTSLTSTLSPYLHFGQISPVEVYLEVLDYRDQYPEAVEGFLEQLLVRRELAFNFVYYLDGYDTFETMTYAWAYQTMEDHLEDEREFIYSCEALENAKTHDPYFNAAMTEMVKTGFMHNYMRMYWGKKIIEWSSDYRTAYNTILTLNNRYFLDGRDPNSYAGVAWLFGRHDRAWTERAIFGKLRYMNANGLKRKFEIEQYVEYTKSL